MSSKQVLLVSALFGCFLSHFSPVLAQNRPYATQQEALIPTYYHQQQQHQSQQQASAHAQSQSNPTYLTYHPHHHPNPTFYHQNVYLASPQQSSAVAAQSQASPQQAGAYYYGAPAGAANLYTYGAQSPGGGAMMVASSSSQAVLTAIPPPTSGHSEHQDPPSQGFSQAPPADYAGGAPSGPKGPPTSTVGPSGAQLGIAFGRPMGGYDGNYYVPVFYPLSWLGNSDPMAAYSSNTHQTTLSSPYGHQTAPNAQSAPPTHYPMTIPAYFPQSLASAVSYPNYRMMLPQSHPYHQHLQQRPYHPQLTSAHPKAHFASANSPAHSPADEMMPSDVNPDMNGNFKRASAYSDAASYFFGDPQALLGQQGPESGSLHEGRDEQSTADGTNAYYYLAPVLKYRDPKDDYNLAIEANKEQMHAQARFEKEVLMSEEMMPGAEYQHQHQEHQPGPGAYSLRPGSYSSSARDSINPLLDPRTGMASPSSLYSNTSHIEARSGRDQVTAGSAQVSAPASQSKPNTNERPILTQIEIYDLPGANKYLGLGEARQQVAPAPSNATEVVPIFAPAPTPLKTHKLPYSALPAAKFYKRKIESMKATEK